MHEDVNDIQLDQGRTALGNALRAAADAAPTPRKATMGSKRYAAIPVDLWHGGFNCPNYPKVSPEGKLLYLYLSSSPISNMLTVYRLPLAYVHADTGLKPDTVTAALKELVDQRLIHYCESTGWVWVVQGFRLQSNAYDMTPTDNRAKGAVTQLQKLKADGCPFVKQIAEHYRTWLPPVQ